ncbi:transposase [Neisseria meningitidis]|nr:transposase [Neisseria meningitidis]
MPSETALPLFKNSYFKMSIASGGLQPIVNPKQGFRRHSKWINKNQDKAMKPQTVQIVRQGEGTPYWFKFKPLYIRGRRVLNLFQFHTQNSLFLFGSEVCQFLRQFGGFVGEHGNGEQCGICRACLADGECGDGYAFGHLYNR